MIRPFGASLSSFVLIMGAIAATAASGARLTRIGSWYRDLRKPSWNPPTWVFPPAWTSIFAMLGIAVTWGLNADRPAGTARWVLIASFVANLLLNVAWSALFFHRRRPDLALREVGFLWLSIVVILLALRSLVPAASWLIVPYLAWVSFASVLNYRIVTLNAPFPQH